MSFMGCLSAAPGYPFAELKGRMPDSFATVTSRLGGSGDSLLLFASAGSANGNCGSRAAGDAICNAM